MTSTADTDAEVEAADTPPPAAPRRRPKLPTIVLTASVALLVAAAAVAGWFGVAWFRAANDDGLAYSRARDDVERVARAAIRTMNTLDYRALDEDLADWADATTGTLNAEVTRLSDEDRKGLVDAKWVAESEVRSLAVRELDARAGKAVVIAAISTTVSIGGAEPETEYKRVEGTLLRTENGWKIDVLGPVRYAQPAAPPSR